MLTLVGLIIVLVAALLQASVLPVILPTVLHLDVRPDLVVLLVIAVAMTAGLREAAIWAFAGGLFLDLLAGLPLGVSAVCLLVVAVLATLGTTIPFRTPLVLPLGLAFLGTALYYLLLLGARSLGGQHFAWLDALEGVLLPSALFNTALMPLAYSFVLWLTDRFTPRLPEEWQ